MNHLTKSLMSLMLLICAPRFAHADMISVRSDKWCPYVCEPTSNRPGYMVEITKLILEKYGHKVDFQIVNWARAVHETRKNKVNALIGCSYADGPDFVFPNKPIGIMKNHYYVRQDSSWLYKDMTSLEGKRIGIINGYSYGDDVDRLIKAKNKAFVVISGERPLEQMLKMMEAKRLDAFVENPAVLRYSLEQMKIPLDTYKAVSMNLAQDPYLYVSFSPVNPKSTAYAKMMAKGISELRQTGELKNILARYGISDWEDPQITILSSINHRTNKKTKVVYSR